MFYVYALCKSGPFGPFDTREEAESFSEDFVSETVSQGNILLTCYQTEIQEEKH